MHAKFPSGQTSTAARQNNDDVSIRLKLCDEQFICLPTHIFFVSSRLNQQ